MAALIPPDLLAMMTRGVSVNVGSRNAALRPSVMRAVGSLIEDEGRKVTVYVGRSQARQLVQDVAATGHIAVVFSEPATHRTLQLKATRATQRNATEDDLPALRAYLASMEHELSLVYIAPQLTRALFAYRLDDVVAITFEPEQAFDQTPGPKAGTTLAAAKP